MHFFSTMLGNCGEILNFLQEVLETCCFKSSFDAFLITLIPKKPGTQNIRDFCPISLVGRVDKILAKVLVNRLKTVPVKAVSKYHYTFVEGRQILDSVLIS